MKNQIVLILAAIVLYKTGYSQNMNNNSGSGIPSPSEAAISAYTGSQVKKDSVPVMKNEIGINLIPIVVILNSSNGSRNIPLAHVFYKRRLKQNLYGRLSLSLNDGLNNQYYSETASLIKVSSPTSTSIERTRYSASNYLQYFAGLEARWGRKQIRQFAGLDLSYANYKAESRLISTPITGNYSPADSTISHYKHINNAVGINPFYGVNLAFSRHFFISA